LLPLDIIKIESPSELCNRGSSSNWVKTSDARSVLKQTILKAPSYNGEM
jgi:hypothetical protein